MGAVGAMIRGGICITCGGWGVSSGMGAAGSVVWGALSGSWEGGRPQSGGGRELEVKGV